MGNPSWLHSPEPNGVTKGKNHLKVNPTTLFYCYSSGALTANSQKTDLSVDFSPIIIHRLSAVDSHARYALFSEASSDGSVA